MKRLFLAMALPALVLSGDAPLTGPIHSGRLPPGVEGGFAAKLDSSECQYLMSSRGGMLVAFAFEHGGFVPRCSLPLPAPIAAPDGGSPLATGSIVAAGDVDGDGLDEIVVAGSRTIRKYKLVRGDFALTAEAAVHQDSNVRPAWCFDVCVGDVNNDGVDEVLATGADSPTSFTTGDYSGKTALFVCHWTDDTLIQIWNDRGTLKLEGPSWVMPIVEMRCVCDPTNRGRPILLMKEGASDVSAGVYRELEWTSGELVSEAYFVIREGRIQRNVADDNPEGSAVGCDFAQVGGVAVVLASVLREEEDSWQGEYFVFSGDSPSQHRVLWSDTDHDYWSPILIDLDGKGIGALRFTYPRGRGPGFEFYRL